MLPILEDVIRKFRERYTGEPLIIRAPGRINLIGEHTDYNNGFVMPAAIDYGTFFAIAPTATDTSEIYSANYDNAHTVDFKDDISPVKGPAWANYLLGIIHQLKKDGHKLKSFNCVFGGNIPIGSGLSSSAALECGFAFALNELNKLSISKARLIQMAQWSEHNFAGVKCGIMDQFASMMGQAGNVILLDCRSLEYSYAPLTLTDHCLVLCDTRVKHALVDSEYNTRRSECERGVAVLKKHYPQVSSLRDVTLAMLQKHRSEFEGKEFNRCLYIVQEIERVLQANEDLKNNDLAAFGKKMFETHKGLSELYQVSCPELDFFAAAAQQYEGVIGARMMGGGFGGCTINIVRIEAVEDFTLTIKTTYKAAYNREAEVYPVTLAQGVSLVNLHESIL